MQKNVESNERIMFYARFALGLVVSAIIVGLFMYNSRPREAAASSIGPGAHMGAVEIYVDDAADVSEFYTEGVGLSEIETTDTSITLGIDDRPLIRLTNSDADRDNPREAGLYHSALLFKNKAALADALVRISQLFPDSYQGSADHKVSMAFYFADADGNGVELYVDRPSDEWQWSTSGEVVMGSDPLDVQQFIQDNATNGAQVANGITMGHVHLRVGDLAEAEKFYVDSLGFAKTANASGARFFSANRYHHHIGTNVWSSDGAGVRPESRGLGKVNIYVTREQDLSALEARLTATDVAFERNGTTVSFADPWGNKIDVSLETQ